MASARDGPLPELTAFRPETIRGAPGHVRVGRTISGSWWLIDADDRPFVSCGVATGDSRSGPLPWGLLDEWGFNTIDGPGPGGDGDWRGFLVETVHFLRSLPDIVIRLQGALVPDVFDPRWVRTCREQARAQCGAFHGNRRLLGYRTDPALNWAQEPAGEERTPRRPTLLQICLSLEPGFAAYHAAWEFTLAAYGGDLEALAASWEVEIPNRETLRQWTQADQPLRTEGYRRDAERFSREFARLYFTTTADAIRQVDPAHLIIGASFARMQDATALADCALTRVDLLSLCWSRPEAAAALERCGAGGTNPLLIDAYSWVQDEADRPSGDSPAVELTPLERMLARGRAELTSTLAHPSVVGYGWSPWRDEPGDQPPFGRGLIRVDGAPAREHIDLLSDLNFRAAEIHDRG